ncbi:hypothetical protein NJC38_02515 [Pseudomonas sp. 21LCFQ010]|uniref:hypothetical protein n=1 Tax=Pseudomonas sp. 21LCFQ010 TaxID=2957506 RepID=UPI002097C1C4|nr:hypothetical protein [Pseudomonas sp. 21LCFQ010]MCO8161023.1 hypothetical protein [Pseudomonas sp. 21LCFQ010]
MTRLALTLMLLATGASAAETPDADIKRLEIERMTFGSGVTVIHDDKRDVTCWVLSYAAYQGGISCVPDSQLKPEPSAKQTQAPKRRVDERYSM